MPDPSTLLLAACMGCVSTSSSSQLQTVAQTQQPLAEPTRSPDTDTVPSIQGQFSMPAVTPPTAQVQVDRRDDAMSQVSIVYLWILGWAVVYVGGSLFIFKEVVKEVQGIQVAKTPVQDRDFATALERIKTQRAEKSLASISPDTTQTQPPQQSVNTNSSTATSSVAGAIESRSDQAVPQAIHETLKQFSSTPASNQVLEVAQANYGRVEPLQNLFVGLNDADSTYNSRLNNRANTTASENSRQVAKPQAARPSIDSQAALRKLIQKGNQTPSIGANAATPATNQEEETVIATLPPANPEETYTYSLLDDAGGLFVLRGHELRLLNSQLQYHPDDASIITVRRTDAQGISVDKTFKLEIKKTQEQLAEQQKRTERVPVRV